MKSHTVYKTFETPERREFVRITEDVAAAVEEAGISEGMALVSAMHITAAVWVNDDEPGLQEDVLEWLDKIAPPSWARLDATVQLSTCRVASLWKPPPWPARLPARVSLANSTVPARLSTAPPTSPVLLRKREPSTVAMPPFCRMAPPPSVAVFEANVERLTRTVPPAL